MTNELVKQLRDWRKAEGLPWNPNFVPKRFDGLADLDQQYWQAEQKAIAFEKNKPAATTRAVSLSAPALRRRKTPSLRTFEELGKFTGSAIHKAIAPLQKRIEALEAAPPVEHKGPWRAGTTYPRNAMVQRSGSCWLSISETAAKPGESPEAWRLVAKRGSDGRGVK